MFFEKLIAFIILLIGKNIFFIIKKNRKLVSLNKSTVSI